MEYPQGEEEYYPLLLGDDKTHQINEEVVKKPKLTHTGETSGFKLPSASEIEIEELKHISEVDKILNEDDNEYLKYDDHNGEHGAVGQHIVRQCFAQTNREADDLDLKNCVLLDSESSVHAFMNVDLMDRVWCSMDNITLEGNSGGSITTYQQGTIKNLNTNDPVWYHPHFMANILSLALLKKQFRITYDSEDGGMFEVHIPEKPSMYFH